MGEGSIGKTAGDEFTTPRVGRMRRSVGLQVLRAETGHKLADRFPMAFVTG